jgi:CheY-like chemotaxis protein
MEAMRGDVGATSAEGQGSAFWLELPADPNGRRIAHEPRGAIAPANAKPDVSGNVVYIEDNPSNVKLLERLLRQRPNVRLTHFPSGAAGIEGVRRLRPDLLLLDRHLPDMTGDEILIELGRNPATASVPVVMLTADALSGGHQPISGLRGYLTKPLDVGEVLRVVDSILSGEGH